MIKSTFIAVTTIMFSALVAGFIVFDTHAQTVTVSPTPTVTTSTTVTPTPTGEVKASTTVPSGAPATGHAE